MRKAMIAGALLAMCAGAMACGSAASVDSSAHNGDDSSSGTPTPTNTESAGPTPTPGMLVRTTFSSIHVYDNGDPVFYGEIYCTVAVDDQVEYTSLIHTGNPSDVALADFGIQPIEIYAQEGQPVYIYADCYDQDPTNSGSDPLGTVNTGWYAGEAMSGYHTVAATNPYYFNLTYKLDVVSP